MSAFTLITGTLFKAPEQRTSKAGKPFTTATVKVRDGESVVGGRCLPFTETTQADLLRLGDGDALSVQGTLRAEVYAPANREPRVTLTILADAILPLRRPRTPKKQPARAAASAPPTAPAAAWDDDFPEGMPL